MKFTIVYGKPKAWWKVLSKLIMYVEKLPYDHVGILVDYYGTQWVFDAHFPVVRRVKYSEWLLEYTEIKQKEIKVASESDAINWLIAQEKKLYSIAQLVLIFLRTKAQKISPWKLNNDKYMICSELCGKFIEEFNGYIFKHNEDQIDLLDMEEYYKS